MSKFEKCIEMSVNHAEKKGQIPEKKSADTIHLKTQISADYISVDHYSALSSCDRSARNIYFKFTSTS